MPQSSKHVAVSQNANMARVPPPRPRTPHSPPKGSNNAPPSFEDDTISEQGNRVSFETLYASSAPGVRHDNESDGLVRSRRSTAYMLNVLPTRTSCTDNSNDTRKSYPVCKPDDGFSAHHDQPNDHSRPSSTVPKTTGSATVSSLSSSTTTAPVGPASFKRNVGMLNNPYSHHHGYPHKAGRNSVTRSMDGKSCNTHRKILVKAVSTLIFFRNVTEILTAKDILLSQLFTIVVELIHLSYWSNDSLDRQVSLACGNRFVNSLLVLNKSFMSNSNKAWEGYRCATS
jgi:hypothetical protein